MVAVIEKFNEVQDEKRGVSLEEALTLTGMGRYNWGVLTLSLLLMLSMGVDLYGVSLILPNLACDLQLDTNQRALLSGLPLAGAVCMLYVWGLTADMYGRRSMLLLGMGVGFLLNLLASIAPEWISFTLLKLFSAGCCASANAIGVVYLGESTPLKYRSVFLFLVMTAGCLTQFFLSVFALPILPMSFSYHIGFLNLTYRSWRLLHQVSTLPCGVGCLMLYWHKETPKFLLNADKREEALENLRTIYAKNTGKRRETYQVTEIYLDEALRPKEAGKSILAMLWHQTTPLFRPPLLKHSLKIYFILISSFATAVSYIMWVPSLTNMYFNTGEDMAGRTFCEVASRIASDSGSNTTVGLQDTTECVNLVERNTLWAVMAYSGSLGVFNTALSFLVGYVGRKRTTLAIFGICSACGLALNLVTVPALSITLFFIFLYIAVLVSPVNSYIIELYPTYLRSTAVCVSVMLARASGVLGINVIAWLLDDYCTHTVYGFVLILICGGVVACFLPPDSNKQQNKT